MGARQTDEHVKLRSSIGRFDVLQRNSNCDVPYPVLWREAIQNDSAANCHLRRVTADDEPVARDRSYRLLQPELRKTRTAGLNACFTSKHNHPRHHLCRPVMQPHSRTMTQRARRAGQQFETDIDHRSTAKSPGGCKNAAALNLFDIDALQVDGRALARCSQIRISAVNLNVSSTRSQRFRQDFKFIARSNLTGDEGAGDHGAKSFDREGAINGQSSDGGPGLRLDAWRKRTQRGF